MNRLLIILLATLLPQIAFASDAPATPAWSGEAELGIVSTGGNTETQTVSAKAKASHDRERTRYTASAEALSATDDIRTTAERYRANVQVDWKLSTHNYLFAQVTWDKDRFSGFDVRLVETAGYGRRLVHRDHLSIDAELGIGARQSKETATGDHVDELLGRAAGNLTWKIHDNAALGEEITIDFGEESVITRSVTSLKTQIADALATKITFTLKNTSTVPTGVEKTDHETAITLVYSF